MRLLGWLSLLLACATTTSGKFERPSEYERLQALGNLFEEPDTVRILLTPSADFPPVKLPGSGDWLTMHSEKGQSFEEYRASGANKPDVTRRIIYLLPIGEFDEEASPPLEEVRTYAAAFFQMEVKLLPAYHPHELEFEPRQNPHDGQRQVLTRSIRTFLRKQLPADAYCLLGITMTDLYPDRSWNFVFGEATLVERVGVYSFARYDPAFRHEPRGKDYRDLILQRSCKVLAHETAHMFGLPHCIYFDCVVNGSNGMNETDAGLQHLCPVCLRKLHQSIGFDFIKRYKEIARFYRRQKWFEDYDWVQRQLEKLPARNDLRLPAWNQSPPGNMLLERCECYLSNIGLPGYWPQASLHIGAPERQRSFNTVERTVEGFRLSWHRPKWHVIARQAQ